ncbi:unnamed protein product [Dovyalis caffra]|uniref:Uncharacterized protein n=1 Tax=Dovyalis caffra TaxID=77055 RepID=A0AAV1RGZ4_9ROSI|nr:unnamed protein product [Dovyalis caffra]
MGPSMTGTLCWYISPLPVAMSHDFPRIRATKSTLTHRAVAARAVYSLRRNFKSRKVLKSAAKKQDYTADLGSWNLRSKMNKNNNIRFYESKATPPK